MYTENDLVRIAKRENNKKRNYLVVNRLQGKHIPVEASKAFELFDALAGCIRGRYEGERLLFIGFAETATAIGAAVAHSCSIESLYMQTTREVLKGVEYLFFSEEHSHATEQKLVKTDLDTICREIDRVIFVEDEVTTGRTILNIIEILRRQYPMIERYAVLSILNGMDQEALWLYQAEQIDLHYLVKTDHSLCAGIAEQYQEDGRYVDVSESGGCQEEIREAALPFCPNPRRLLRMKEYDSLVEALYRETEGRLNLDQYHSILVLGTEEFMYPALRIAERLEAFCEKVRCHSTTRSPIAVSKAEGYPLHTRYQLRSLYEKSRVTYLYDLEPYECVLIVTDAEGIEKEGQDSLVAALRMSGNYNINIVRWC